MSDGRPQESAPLFPRRPLTASSPAQDPTAAERDSGPPTAAMPRVAPQAEPRVEPGVEPGVEPEAKPRSEPARAAAAAVPASAAATEPSPAKASGKSPVKTAPRQQRTRRARLRVTRVDPWSVMKMAFALSIALAVVIIIAVAIVWSVLDAAGVWAEINTAVATFADPQAGEERFDVNEFVGLGRVMGFTLVISAANVVLLTALATLGAFMYNLASALLGGLEVTLTEDR